MYNFNLIIVVCWWWNCWSFLVFYERIDLGNLREFCLDAPEV